jgi:hypothetical protein
VVITTDGRAFTSAISERVSAFTSADDADDSAMGVNGGGSGDGSGTLPVEGFIMDGAGGGAFDFSGDARVYLIFRAWCSCGWEESFEDEVSSREDGEADYDLIKLSAQEHWEAAFKNGDFSHKVNWGYREK